MEKATTPSINVRKKILDYQDDELANLNGFRRLPPQWAVEWEFLFDMPGAQVRPQPSLLIDAQLAKPLATLPPSVLSGR